MARSEILHVRQHTLLHSKGRKRVLLQLMHSSHGGVWLTIDLVCLVLLTKKYVATKFGCLCICNALAKQSTVSCVKEGAYTICTSRWITISAIGCTQRWDIIVSLAQILMLSCHDLICNSNLFLRIAASIIVGALPLPPYNVPLVARLPRGTFVADSRWSPDSRWWRNIHRYSDSSCKR